ncbi:MAG: tetratricopeptide repeat protein [Verrucomicrobia bacterium]|nr:tetratricopeptide repeat protein [Verrucomicrobiota bacterium]
MLLLANGSAFASDATAEFDTANKLFEQGKFPDAAVAYEKMLADGHSSAPVWFNLGNARFKAGQFGRAIAAYRQAELLAPRDAEVRANLQFARTRVAGGLADGPPLWQRALDLLSLNEWAALATIAFWIVFALLALRQWRPQWRTSLRSLTASSTAVLCVFAACLAASVTLRYGRPTAVVTATEVVVRYGPLDESKTFFTLRDGAEVRVIGRKDDWIQVLDTSQRAGWVKRAQVTVFPPEKNGSAGS